MLTPARSKLAGWALGRGRERAVLRQSGRTCSTSLPCGITVFARSGRTDLLAALGKVFDEASRVDEFDFHNSDLSKDMEVEVFVGDLRGTLEQGFLDPSMSSWIFPKELAETPGTRPMRGPSEAQRSLAVLAGAAAPRSI